MTTASKGAGFLPRAHGGGRRRSPGSGAAVLLGLVLLAAHPETAAAATELRTETGLRITIHTAEDIRADWLDRQGDRVWLRHPTAGTLELDTTRHPWSQLTPVALEDVRAALSAMQGFRTDLQVEVFLLPGLPAETANSFARRQAIFLAPGLRPVPPQTVAYVATHEMGHVLCWAALDGRPRRWEAYRALRGLEVQTADPATVAHADRHREIIAEDLRHLFGGALATGTGTIENAALALPETIAGLRDLLAGFLADLDWPSLPNAASSQVYPNPSVDLARVELMVGEGADKDLGGEPVLEILDVRGRLVRRLVGGQLANGRVTVTWDGRLPDGRRAAAGSYLYRIRGAGAAGSGRLLLLSR